MYVPAGWSPLASLTHSTRTQQTAQEVLELDRRGLEVSQMNVEGKGEESGREGKGRTAISRPGSGREGDTAKTNHEPLRKIIFWLRP